MSDGWKTVPATEVQVGQRVRASGTELTVSRIDTNFLGRPDMLAFIEDTPERWFKRPARMNADVEVAED